MLSKKAWKRICALVLSCTMLMTVMTGCGKKEVVEEAKEAFTYVPEYITMEGMEDSNFYNMQLTGDAAYFSKHVYDEEAMTSSQTIYKYSLTGQGQPQAIPYVIEGQKDANYFYIDDEDNLYLLIDEYEIGDYVNDSMSYQQPQQWYYLQKVDAQGNLLFEEDITQQMNQDEEHNYFDNMIVDGEGRVYMTSSNWVVLFDEEMKYHGVVDLGEEWINSIGCGKDGKVYVSYYDQTSTTGGYILAEIDFAAKSVGATYSNFQSGNGNYLSTGIEKDFLVADYSSVLEYDMETQTCEKLFDWLDSDINGNFVRNVMALEDGRLFVSLMDWNTGVSELAILTKTKTSELPQKEQLTIGMLYSNQEIQSAAVEFNKNSDKYHVNIKTYIDENNWSETSITDGIAKMNSEIAAGTNVPDIMELSQINVAQLASKGAFEDMSSYLESSNVLSKEAFLDNIVDSYTFDGKLVAIPYTFTMTTVAGAASKVGDEMGWTLADMIAFSEKYPDKKLFDYATKTDMMNTLLMYNQEAFINWETGECNFDSQEFKDLLNFVNKFPDEYVWEEGAKSTPLAIQDGDVLLEQVNFYDFENLQVTLAAFGEPITCVGYPTTDGSAGCMMSANTVFAITSQSGQKEGAWSFIENFFTKESTENGYFWGFPTQKEKLNSMLEDAVTVKYVLDENGEPYLDENGEPIQEGGNSSVSYGDWEYTFHRPTVEEVELVRGLIDVAKPVGGGTTEISAIIAEEAAAFFEGQKTVDDVVNIIQSRLQIYVSENS